MARIITSVIFLVVLVVLIVLNVGAAAPVNVFGWKFDSVSIIVVGLVCFVAGVVYSFIFYLLSYLERGRRDRLNRRKRKLKDQEAELKTREQEVDVIAEESRRQLEAARNLDTVKKDQSQTGIMANLFGRKKPAPEPEVSAEQAEKHRKNRQP